VKICMLLHKSVVHDSRVRREAKALAAAGHDVTVVHLAPAAVPPEVRAEGYGVVSALPHRLGLRRLPFAAHRLAFAMRFVGAVRALRPDAVHAHDAAMLAPGWVGAGLTGAHLVYDTHELATGVAYRSRPWAAMVSLLERLFIGRCAAVITVSDGIARRLQTLYELRRTPAVVRNVPELGEGRAGEGLRDRLGIGDAALILHQGALAPGRGCETLVSAMADVPDAHLVFLGTPWPGYEGVVEALAEQLGLRDRVHFAPAVPPSELLAHTREADVGVALLEDTCENHRLALPNKVFEYVAAGVPVVASRLPELQRLVERHEIGWTASPGEPAEIAARLRTALAARSNGGVHERVRVAAGALQWGTERDALLTVYCELPGRDG
jgi:glycosyltransferase involved in cell wall biosynthesis